MSDFFCRASTDSHEWAANIAPLIHTHGIVLHPADQNVSRTHIHFIISLQSEMGVKTLHKLIRKRSGLTGRMDIAMKPFDSSQEYAKYLLRNSTCKLLYHSDTPIGTKLLQQSLTLPQVPLATPSVKRENTMAIRINHIYDTLCQDTTQPFQSFAQFANEMLRLYYKDHIDELIPGEGSINAFKSYIMHLWGCYIQNHVDPDSQDRLRGRYVRLLFGQTLVDPVHDLPSL